MFDNNPPVDPPASVKELRKQIQELCPMPWREGPEMQIIDANGRVISKHLGTRGAHEREVEIHQILLAVFGNDDFCRIRAFKK